MPITNVVPIYHPDQYNIKVRSDLRKAELWVEISEREYEGLEIGDEIVIVVYIGRLRGTIRDSRLLRTRGK
jgi:hypothetical protein